ncbi:GNAT family N-acetyltransferase [Pseudomonas sp. YQ_6]|jgi:RimJ/RimL family protein N-acetyltransferase|uniref:N-acetyltransferase domain-containing protein n=1 Tax=Pseudomonas putida S12 TaxID=1215087 RepID=A0AA34WPM3_PSEPU|nr:MULTISPECIES: GNAT family N-acetyltransferase [Pseudomonas]AJA12055.1 hypothetical protein RPPX_01480 [Pseudomonas putida S12]AOX08313.1 hypothetical protein Q5O_07925 [Pseudomonas putida JB]MCI1022927.1 GNAT family N-acetyltransferase [Pseudomonas putida]MDN4515996.1 GNAT family N-acetyltransferase [Pseudomonas sp. 2,4-D]MDW2777538.1 GNAT family N-acetyltransferase [Pseudomonas sp. BEA3.1]
MDSLPILETSRLILTPLQLGDAPAIQQLIGSISLYDQPGNNRGFWLATEWQRNGYIREACVVINEYWFETLGRCVMQVPKAASNDRSRSVSVHEGMRLVGTEAGHFVCGAVLKEIWELSRDEWRQRAAVV